MKFFKNKKIKWVGVLFFLIIVFVSNILLHPIEKITSNVDLLAFFNGETIEERPLSEIVNTMYVTMIDNKQKVVATTNPDIEIDKDYTFSDEQVPVKQPNINDTYKILYEIVDTNDENGYAKMEEGVIYTLELPEYIEPQDVYEESITKKCTEFTKKGKSVACGGIYKENDKYIFKVKFKDVLNKKDVKANYQYSIKLDKKIKDVVFDIKTLDFKLPGIIHIFMPEEIPVVTEIPKYEINIQNRGYTSKTEKYVKWEVTIKDNQEDNAQMNGDLLIDFGEDMGMEITRYEWFSNFEVYADGNLLNKIKKNDYKEVYYRESDNGNNEWITIDINNSDKNASRDGFAYFLKDLKIEIHYPDGTSIPDIKEWKFEFVTANYYVVNGNDYHDSFLQVKLADNNEEGKYYQGQRSIRQEYNMPSVSFSRINSYGLSSSGFQRTMEYKATITSTNSNVLTIMDDSNEYNDSGMYYYISNKGFSPVDNSLNTSIEIYIDNQLANFSYKGSFDDPSTIQGYGDGGLSLQIKNSADSYGQSGYYVYRSDIINADGKYYWVIISKDTYNMATNSPSYYTDGRDEYAKNTTNTAGIYEPAKWKIYLYNAAGCQVDVIFQNYLDKTEDFSRDSSKSSTTVNNLFSVSIDKNLQRTRGQSSPYSGPNAQPMKAIGEWVDNDTIKWNVVIDFDGMNMSLNSLYYYDFYVYTPKNQYMTNNRLLYYCKDIYCENKSVTGAFGMLDGNIPNDDLLAKKLFYKDYNRYRLTNTSRYIQNGKLYYTFETKINNYTENTNKDSEESIYIGFIGSKRSNLSYSGNSLKDINLYVKSAVYNPLIKKNVYDMYVKDKKMIQRWEVSSDLYTSNKEYKDMYFPDTVTNAFKASTTLFYYGTYTFTDQYKTSNKNEEIIAKNTLIDEVVIEIFCDKTYRVNGKLKDFSSNDKNEYYKDFSTDTGSYKVWAISNNENNYPNMKDGVTFKVEGIKRGYFIRITYITSTDIEKIAEELEINSTDRTRKIILSNSAIWNMDGTKSNNPTQNNKVVTADATYELLADLSINKSVSKEDDKNYGNDSKRQEVLATIGYTSSKYLDITDFIDGVSNLKYNFNTKTYEKEDLSTELNRLKEIRKYVDISNLKISVQNHYYGTYTDIYSNGSFISEYNESTLTYVDNSNELYKIHLVRSDGKDIPALTDVKVTYDMTFNLDKEDSYRLKDIYKGGKYYISTNVEGIRSYEAISNGSASGLSYQNKEVTIKKLSSQDGNYENKIDSTNKTLTAYASNTGASIGADYLEPPTINKIKTENKDNGQSKWQITYNVNSTGKKEKVDLDIQDTLSFKVEGNSAYNNQIISILEKYVKYKDLKVYYNGKDTSIDNNPIYTYNKTLNSNQTISENGVTGTLKSGESSYSLNLSSFNYGDVVIITYELDIDFESAYQEIIEKGYIDSDYKLKDTNEILKITYTNGVVNPYYEESFVEQAGSKVSISDFMPTIHKRSNGTNNDETAWEVSFNTGTNSSEINVEDEVEVSSEEKDLKEIIRESLILKDLEIKVGEEVVYSNQHFLENWKDNITIKEKELGYEFIFKDSSDKQFISDNNKVVITYKTGIDNNKYNGKKSGLFSLNNKATITKNNFSSMDEVSVSEINYEFPVTVEKEFLGNNNDLTETNWKITVNSGRMSRKNLKVMDTSTLGMDFGKYLSLSSIKVVVNGEEIKNYTLLDKEGNPFVLNKIGNYEFDLLLDNLEKDSTLEIYYTLKVDKEEYILHGGVLDNELLIENNVQVTSDDGVEAEDGDKGSSKVLSKLTKKFDFLGYDEEGYPQIRWYIDVNLENEYNLEEIKEKEVTITDALSDILELTEGTITLNTRSVSSNGIRIGEVIDSTLYEVNTENNTVEVKLLNPEKTSNIRVTFDTVCYASISELENYVTLKVGEEEEEVKSKEQLRIFSPIVTGVISSREVLDYNIKAKKYFDGDISDRTFVFEVMETDEEKNPLENGFTTRNTNSGDGVITFNALTYEEEGFYYYVIKEIKEEDESIIYDDTEYFLRIKVGEAHGSYVIEDVKLLDSEEEEMIFHNKTKPKEEEKPNIKDILVNPNTGRNIIVMIGLILSIILGGICIKKRSN